MCHRVLQQKTEILQEMDLDNSLNWLIRRLLVVCLKSLSTPELASQSFQCLDVFTSVNNSRTKLETWPYLISKGNIYILNLNML